MRRRSRAGGEPTKAQRRKTGARKSRITPKAVRPHSSSAAREETEVARLTRELHEAFQQQTATADVLKAISRSAFDLQSVLNTLVESAARLCEADSGVILRPIGKSARYRRAASYGHTPEFIEHTKTMTLEPGCGGINGRVLLEGRSVQIPDVLADPEYTFLETARVGNYRTILGVPLLREGIPIGIFNLDRAAVRPFTEKQIKLVETFADQAVIAIENVRLFEAEQQRTRELTESLEQQTATSEVLQVISRSTGDLQPVFESLLRNATQLCKAKFGTLYLQERGGLRLVAAHDMPAAFSKAHNRVAIEPAPGGGLQRAMKIKHPVQIPDLAATEAYRQRYPSMVEAVELGGIRTVVAVPMLKDDEPIGVITINRPEVIPFDEKQIGLLTNFAAQAVIAIENARLLNELRQRTDDLTERTADLSESLEQQTATANVLEVISRSAFDLQAVFETVAESSARLCGADRAFIFRFDGELLRVVATFNAAPEFKEWVEKNPIRPGRNSTTARAALECRTIHIPDVQADPEYSYGAKDVETVRTVLAVPVLKGDILLGS